MFWRAEQKEPRRSVHEQTGPIVDVEPTEAAGVELGDVLFVLFRRKGLILLFALAGLAVAAGIYFLRPPVYVSEAKLLIRYVVERKTVNPTSPDSQIKAPDSGGRDILASEAAILSSLDLARATAELVTPQRILGNAGGPRELDRAAVLIADDLKIVPRGSGVLEVSFRHRDPDVVQPVLTNLIALYLQKHVEVHRGAGAVDEFIASQADQLKGELMRTETELQNLLKEAGVVSVEEARRSISEQLAKIQTELRSTEAELAQKQAALKKMAALNASSTNLSEIPTPPAIAPAQITEYRSILSQLEAARKDELDWLSRYKEGSALVVGARERVRRLETRKAELEQLSPQLLSTATASADGRVATDPNRELVEIASLEAKIQTLRQQIEEVKAEGSKLDRVESTIAQLRRDRMALETNYQYLKSSLRQARFDEALGPGKVSNIYTILHPTPPSVDRNKTSKMAGVAAVGGGGLGVALAFLIELFLDRRIKRGVDVEKKLRLPLFLSIPRLRLKGAKPTGLRAGSAAESGAAAPLSTAATPSGKPALGPPPAENVGHQPGPPRPLPPSAQVADEDPQKALRALFKKRAGGLLNGGDTEEVAETPNGQAAATQETGMSPSPPMTWHAGSPLRPYSEALRDRLITYFDSRNVAHKPKLVAVTSCNQGAGVSSVASGLAAALSETGEGKVLLVDLNLERGAAHPYYEGRPVVGMSEALERGNKTGNSLQSTLCLATANEGQAGTDLPAVLPRSFRQLVPRLKSSDFDYIIFDMPPVDETSVTPRLSSFMDLVVMVVESEKTHVDAAKKAAWLLAQVKVDVACILNKKQECIPSMLQREA